MQWYAQMVVITSSCSITRVNARETFMLSFSSWLTTKRDWRIHNGGISNRATRDLTFVFLHYFHSYFGWVKEFSQWLAGTSQVHGDCNTQAVYIGAIKFVPNVTIEDQMKSSIDCWWYRSLVYCAQIFENKKKTIIEQIKQTKLS